MPIALSAFGLSFVLLLVLSWGFRKLGWLDNPERYGHQRQAVPYGIGIVFFLVFLICSLFFFELNPKLIALLISGGILTLICFLDDHYELSAVARLLVQLICALIVVLAGVGVPALTNPLGGVIVLDGVRWAVDLGLLELTIEPLADLVAMIWIVFVINAMNWLDGTPGMVSGTSTIACVVIFLLATMTDLHVIDQSDLASMALVVGSASFAFLLFDFPKPKVLMGDSGAMFLGLVIAVMAIFSGGKLATAFIVLAFPILDAVWTIARRLLKGQSPFKGDFQHFHHELMRAGLSDRQVNLFYYSISIGFGATALYLHSFGKLVAIFVLFGIMVGIRFFLSTKKAWR